MPHKTLAQYWIEMDLDEKKEFLPKIMPDSIGRIFTLTKPTRLWAELVPYLTDAQVRAVWEHLRDVTEEEGVEGLRGNFSKATKAERLRAALLLAARLTGRAKPEIPRRLPLLRGDWEERIEEILKLSLQDEPEEEDLAAARSISRALLKAAGSDVDAIEARAEARASEPNALQEFLHENGLEQKPHGRCPLCRGEEPQDSSP